MSFWSIPIDDYLSRFRFTTHEDVIYNIPNFANITEVVPLRAMERVLALMPIPDSLLRQIISQVRTPDNELCYEKSTLQGAQLDSQLLKIGQRFVYRDKYQAIIENISGIFGDYQIALAKGINNLGAYFIMGGTCNRKIGLAVYLPIIVEKHQNSLVVLDGIHRAYLAHQIGSTIRAIVVDNASVPPFEMKDWNKIKVISLADRPGQIADRYFGLQENNFRNLKHLGIDA